MLQLEVGLVFLPVESVSLDVGTFEPLLNLLQIVLTMVYLFGRRILRLDWESWR